MKAEVFITETDKNGDMFSSCLALVGSPLAISQEIAAHSADMTFLCHTGELKCYTILTSFVNKSGEEVVR